VGAAVDVSTDVLALGERLLTLGAKGIPLDAYAAHIYARKSTSYTPHFVNHPEDVCTEFVVTAYSQPDIDAATTHVLHAIETIIRPNTIWECIRGHSKSGAAYVSHIYCYPRAA